MAFKCIKGDKVIEGKEIEVLNLLWGILVIPLGYLIKLYRDNRELKAKNYKLLTERVEQTMSKDEIKQLIKEELLPIMTKQADIENDFKQVNKDFIGFTQSFYAKMNDITLRVLGK